MATTLVAYADGNWNTAGSWANPTQAGGDISGTPFLDSDAASGVSLGTSYYNPGAGHFTVAAGKTLTIDGLAVKIKSRATNVSTYTMTVAITTGTGTAVSGTEVTINASDIVFLTGSSDHGWYFFKFSSPVTLGGAGAIAYSVNAKVSNANAAIVLYGSTASTANVSRYVRPNSASGAAPTTDDRIIIVGEWTGAGAQTVRTITQDNTAATSFGLTSYPQSLHIGSGGVLTYGTAASTNYLLTIKGFVRLYGGGTLNMGTSGARIPSTSKADLKFEVAGDGDSSLTVSSNGGTLNCYGNNISYVMDTLNGDASGSSFATAHSTGWVAGDEVVLPSTSTTTTQSERKTIDSISGGTTVNLTTSLSNTHSGTSPLVATVGNLTRNVRIYGTDATHRAYIHFGNSATVHAEYTEIYFMGTGAPGKLGIQNGNILGNISITYSSIHDCVYGFYATPTGATAVNNLTIENNVFYNNLFGVYLSSLGLGSSGISVSGNLLIKQTNPNANLGLIVAQTLTATITNNIMAGSDASACGILLQSVLGTISGNTMYSLSNGIVYGVTALSQINATVSNSFIYRCNVGIALGTALNFVVDTATITGCVVGVNFANGADYNTFYNLTIDGEASFATTYSIQYSSSSFASNNRFVNCSFSQTTAATTDFRASPSTTSSVYFDNCAFGTNPEYTYSVSGFSYSGSRFYSTDHNQVSSSYKFVNYGTGTGTSDTVVTPDTAPSSLRMTPSTQTAATSASSPLKFESPEFLVPVNAGQSLTVSVRVREDATYASANPHARLIVKASGAVGINSDTVLDTWAGSADSWDTLSGVVTATRAGILKFIVDCSGNTGFINVDTWNSTTINNSKNYDYNIDGRPAAWANNFHESRATFYNSNLRNVTIN